MRAIWRRGLLTACFVLAVTPFVRADSKPDLSSPKKAAAAFAIGLQAGDFDQVKASSIGDAADYKLMQSYAATMESVHKLHDAAVSRFGVEEAKKVGTGVAENGDIAGQVQASDEKVAGDSATIVEKGKTDTDAIHLRNVNGDWRVDLTTFPQKQRMQQTVPLLEAMRTVMTQSTADVLGGRYKNAQEAGTEVQRRISLVTAAVLRQQIPQAPQTAPAK